MPFPKGYYYDGKFLKKSSDKFFLILGIIGSIILLYSFGLNKPQIGYIIGSICMLLVAIHFQLIFFIALELILISGHTAILLGIGPYLQIALPSLLSFQIFVYFLLTKQLRNPFLISGVIGISMLSVGFAFNNEWIFFFGSIAIIIYATHLALSGIYPCYLWVILNTIFIIITLIKLLT